MPLNSFRKYLLNQEGEVREMLRQKRAQSTLEYIIIFTAVVGAILLAANTIIKPKVNSMLEHVAGEAENAVNHVSFQ
ncbi:class III signal peptide-containing protein [bacterium]|nr:MAG: class III signal peptide-containing protein [bacterium]